MDKSQSPLFKSPTPNQKKKKKGNGLEQLGNYKYLDKLKKLDYKNSYNNYKLMVRQILTMYMLSRDKNLYYLPMHPYHIAQCLAYSMC